MDGNEIGGRINDLILKNRFDDASLFIESFSKSMSVIQTLIIQTEKPEFVIVGGDDILSFFDLNMDLCKRIQSIFLEMTGCTISIGIGSSPVEADLALDFAKKYNLGICQYDESGYK